MSKENMDTPLVSIIITTKNEEKNIENCLKSIKGQAYPQEKIDVIVVDNASNDKTKEIALKYTAKVYDKGPERSAQRNYGMIDKSSGQYVMYIDADMLLSPLLVSECVTCITQTQYAALHIKEIILGTSFWSKVRRFERGFYDGTVIDGARFFKKDVFVKVGGFDEKLFFVGSGEDWDIDKNIKELGQIGLLDAAPASFQGDWPQADFVFAHGVTPAAYGGVIYHNEAKFSLWKYLKKKYYYTKGFDRYIKRWGADDPDIKKQFGLWYRYLGVFFEKGKWMRLVKHPLLTLGMYLLRVLVGLVFVLSKMIPPRQDYKCRVVSP